MSTSPSHYVRSRGKILGPFSVEQLQRLRDRGQLFRFHEVSEDRLKWVSAAFLTEVFPPEPPPMMMVVAEAPSVHRAVERTVDDEPDLSQSRPHRSGTVLTMGILALLLACGCPLACWIVGGIGLNMANTDLNLMARRKMDRSGQGTTNTGKILAIIGLILGTINAIVGAIAMSSRH